MNTENILKLADFLERMPPGRFDMSRWAATKTGEGINESQISLDCGSICCIGGWANFLFDTVGSRGAARSLGFSEEDVANANIFGPANDLFFPKHADAITERDPERAARVLRHLAATGKVDWSIL